jgi:hypothetical protein
LREITDVDDRDAVLTLQALLDVTADPDPSMAKLWARKAQLIDGSAP